MTAINTIALVRVVRLTIFTFAPILIFIPIARCVTGRHGSLLLRRVQHAVIAVGILPVQVALNSLLFSRILGRLLWNVAFALENWPAAYAVNRPWNVFKVNGVRLVNIVNRSCHGS